SSDVCSSDLRLDVSDAGAGWVGIRWEPWDEQILLQVKTIPNRRYEPETKRWIFPANQQNALRVMEIFELAAVFHSELLFQSSHHHQSSSKSVESEEADLATMHRELRLRGYSPKTIRSYLGHVNRFYRYRSTL